MPQGYTSAGAAGRRGWVAGRGARPPGALSVMLKVEVDNAPALAAYRSAGYEEMSRRGSMATMRLDLE